VVLSHFVVITKGLLYNSAMLTSFIFIGYRKKLLHCNARTLYNYQSKHKMW